MSKNLFSVSLLFDEILTNFPFFISPIKRKSLSGISDLVTKVFKFISMFLLIFLRICELLFDEICFNKRVASYFSPFINIFFPKIISKSLLIIFFLKVLIFIFLNLLTR